MSVKKGGCLIPTVIIIVAIILGFYYFYSYFLEATSIVGFFVLILLPYLYYNHEMNSLVNFVTKDRINEYYNNIYGLSELIDDDDVKEKIKSIEEGLGDLRRALESKVDFYDEIIANDEKIIARQKTKK